MRTKITVEVNPYLKSTHLDIKGGFYTGGRLSSHMEGRPLEDWLFPRRVSYQRWDGFLPELVKELSEDELDIKIYSSGGDAIDILLEIEKQLITVRDMGFGPENISVINDPGRFDYSKILNRLLEWRREADASRILIPPTQVLLMRRDVLDRELRRLKNMSDPDRLGEFYRKCIALCRDCEEVCVESQRGSWSQYAGDLQVIFTKGVSCNG